MGVPTLEKAPGGLSEPWLGYWRVTLRQLKEQDTWKVSQRPLLDSYVLALQGAEQARLAGESVVWDRHTKRASHLADLLAITPRGRKAAGLRATAGVPREPSVFDDLERQEPVSLDAARASYRVEGQEVSRAVWCPA
jgi:hypothetical protein